MTPKRIAYVLNIFPKISETFIAGELAELRKRGVELRILSLLPPRDEPQHEIIRRAGLDALVEYDVAKFASVISEFQPELIHAHFAKEATEKARELSALTGIPFTFTAHGYDIHRKPPADFFERAKAAGTVVTVSEANKEFIAENFRVLREHIRVIACGVDTERFCPSLGAPAPKPAFGAAQQGNAPAGVPALPGHIVCVARHVAVKNLGLLLDACALLRNRGVPFRCTMIGDGPLHDELKAKRAALKLDDVVEMPGAADQDEVLRAWQQADIGVLTSENEGMPVCLMEAAACGVPVVATRVGGVPELVAHGVTGMLTAPGNVIAFADALEILLGNAAFRAHLGAAARARAVERFSVSQQVDALMEMWSKVLLQEKGNAQRPTSNVQRPNFRDRVTDPFGAASDPALPSLTAALDFERVHEEFKHAFPSLSSEGFVRPKKIRVVRHKPGKRAVVEYDVRLREHGAITERLTLIGKLRARRYGNEGFRMQEAIWKAGFDATSADGIAVPEPLGVITDFKMWFQRKVPGVTAEEFFAKAGTAESIALARKVAEAIHKLHRAGVPTEKSHTMADELRILRECFAKVAAVKPAWTGRIAKLQRACEQLGASVGATPTCGIHRDFYSAQVIVDGARLWLIDFDLYCQGDPGLDVGNFIGHLSEQALRERGDAGALADVERALEERFVELSGEGVRKSVRAYTTLTLARHVFLSTRFPEREHLTERLMELCEARLGI